MSTQEVTAALLSTVQALAPLIREHAAVAEEQRCLAPPVVAALVEAGLFRLYTPRALGGLEVDPVTFYRVVEAIAQVDGSTAWCVWVGSGNVSLIRALADGTAEAIFGRDPAVVTAGVLTAGGKATACDDGYVVNGRWPYASGCQHSTWAFVMCKVCDGNQMRVAEGGRPELRTFFVPMSDVTVEETWDVGGLAGTGSHDILIHDLFVPRQHSFYFGPGMRPQSRYFQGPLYQFPIYAASLAPIGALALGIAQGVVDAGMTYAHTKSIGPSEHVRDKVLFQVRLAEAVAAVRAARAWLYASVGQCWEAQLTTGAVCADQRADLLLAAANATRSAAAAVDTIYTACGPTANYRHSPLQRALRDIHALTQHMATAPMQYESVGRMLLGLQPLQPPLILW